MARDTFTTEPITITLPLRTKGAKYYISGCDKKSLRQGQAAASASCGHHLRAALLLTSEGETDAELVVRPVSALKDGMRDEAVPTVQPPANLLP